MTMKIIILIPGSPVPYVFFQVASSIVPMNERIWRFGPKPRALTALIGSASEDRMCTYCWKMNPNAANIATRPCFNSAARAYVSGIRSEKPRGSKPLSLSWINDIIIMMTSMVV